MCGRYCLYSSVSDWGQVHFPRWHDDQHRNWQIERFNIAPSQKATVCLADRNNGTIKVTQMRWGFNFQNGTGKWSTLTNARAETIGQRVAFADAFRYRRCLVPADGFYEWKRFGRNKQPYYFSFAGPSAFAMAAIWEEPLGSQREPNQDLRFCVLTTSANEQVSDVHHRMPVILEPPCYHSWLCPQTTDDASIQGLLQPLTSQTLRRWPVSTLVNRVTSDSPACIQEIDSPARLATRQGFLF